jgi:hypothetical protein
MLKLIAAYWHSQLVFVAAKLGIADALKAGPLTVAELAGRVDADSATLHRIMRALASLGVFAKDSLDRYRLTPLAHTLRTDHPESLRDFALMMVDGDSWKAWGALDHAATSGESPFEHVHGLFHFPFMEAHPEKEVLFSASMASLSAMENGAVARAYKFGKMRTLVDVGGAHGHLLASILRVHFRLQGVLFDQPQVIEAAAKSGFITAPDIGSRCETQSGDFFEAVPRGADAYIMKYVLHDWDDDRCVRILLNCRQAMADDGRVLVVERVLRGANRPDWGKLLDINMMVITGGRERTKEEFRRLFARAGLRLKRIIRTASPIKILEAIAA